MADGKAGGANPGGHHGARLRHCLQDFEARAAAHAQRHNINAGRSHAWAHVCKFAGDAHAGIAGQALHGRRRVAPGHHKLGARHSALN